MSVVSICRVTGHSHLKSTNPLASACEDSYALLVNCVQNVFPLLRPHERPNNTVRILYLSEAVAPEHVGRRYAFAASRRNGLVIGGIDVGHLQHQRESRGGQVRWCMFGTWIAEHQRRPVYVQMHMHGSAAFIGRK